MTITEFFEARLAEDEAVAQAAVTDGAADWHTADHPMHEGRVTNANGDVVVYDEGAPTGDEAIHIARHDPTRVLREVEVKRAIVAEHQASVRAVSEGLSAPTRRILGALASVYADHPDYRGEWRP